MSLQKGKQSGIPQSANFQAAQRLQGSRPEDYVTRQSAVVASAAAYPGQQQQSGQIRQSMQPGQIPLVHDMSKQHYQQQPGLGGVSSQTPPQQQQQQTVQHVGQQQQTQAVTATQMVYNPGGVRQQQQQVQTRPQGAITMLTTTAAQGGTPYYQQSQVRPMQSMQPARSMNPAAAQQPAASMYHQHMYVSHGHLSQVPQAPIMNYTQPQMAMQIRSYQAPYPSQAAPQVYVPTYSPTLFYPPPMSVPQQHGRPQQMQQAVQPQTNKEKKMILIQDPESEKELDVYELAKADSRQTPPMSGASSARGTPPTNATPPPALEANDVPAQFAQQVAAVAAMGPIIHHGPLPVVVIPPSLETPLPPPQLVVAPSPPPPAVVLDKIHVALAAEEPSQPPPPANVPEEVTEAVDSSRMEAPIVYSEPVVAKVEETQPAVEVTVEEIAEVVAAPAIPAAVEVTVPEPPVRSVVLSEGPGGEKQVPSQQNARHKENGDLPVPPPQQVTETEAAAKDNTKNKKKKKTRDLNKKGEAKESGGEMDLFTGPKEEKPVVASANARHQAAPSQPQQQQQAQPLPAPTPAAPVQAQPQRIPDVSEEERKVAVKNEENAKVSKEMEQKQWNDAKKAEPPGVIEAPVTINITPAPVLPTYQYKKDQWSPLNPDGKKQYDRGFLLAQQDKPLSIMKPEGLPNLEVIKDVYSKKTVDRSLNSGSLSSRSMGGIADFTPTYIKSVGRGGRMSQPGRKLPEQKKISLSLNQEVKLHESENAWKASYRNEKEEAAPENIETDGLLKCVRSILNKLTPQNFGSLLDRVRSLVILDEDRFSKVIDLVFEKAIGEPNFSTAYAKMCKELAMMRVQSSTNPEEVVNFRKLLINRCQKEFERDKHDELLRDARRQKSKVDNEEKQKQLNEELAEAEAKARRRSLGNIRFIGELFKLEMLTAKIMHECLNKLITGGDEDSLECLCRLLTTIGKELDTKRSEQPPTTTQKMDGYFVGMMKIVKEKKTSSRVRFMLQDVCDLRLNKWVPRRDENNPRTLDQIKREAEREHQIQNMMAQQHIKKPMDDRDRRRSRGPPMQYNEGGSSIWNTVGKQRMDIKLNLNKPTCNDDVQLGPSSGSNWGKGSSGGVKSNVMQENTRTTSIMSNKFSVLNDGSDKKTPNTRPPQGPARGRGVQTYVPGSQRSAKHLAGQDEKEQAIAAARMVYGAEDNKDSRQSRESSVSSEDPRQAPVALVLSGDPNMDLGKLEFQCGSCIDAYLKNLETQDATQTVITICSSKTINTFLNVAFNRVLERKSSDRLRTGQLLHHLMKKGAVTVDQFMAEFAVVLSTMRDIIVDVPHAWDYIGEIVSQTMLDGLVSFKVLKDGLQPWVKCGYALECLTWVLHHMVQHSSKMSVRDMWVNSRLNLSEFVGEGQQISTELEYLTSNSGAAMQGSKKPEFESIQKELFRQLKEGISNDDIFNWVNHHVDTENVKTRSFIRALVCAVADSAIAVSKSGSEYHLNKDTFKNRINLILKYVDGDEVRELQALYALQSLATQMQHPQKLLHEMFEILSNSDIISDDGFLQWSSTDSPMEAEGHRVAVMTVKPFLDWLKQPENSSNSKDGAAN